MICSSDTSSGVVTTVWQTLNINWTSTSLQGEYGGPMSCYVMLCQLKTIKNEVIIGVLLSSCLSFKYTNKLLIDNLTLYFSVRSYQSGPLSLVEECRGLVESYKVLKYFHDVATPALLRHKEPAQGMKHFVHCAFRWFFIA